MRSTKWLRIIIAKPFKYLKEFNSFQNIQAKNSINLSHGHTSHKISFGRSSKSRSTSTRDPPKTGFFTNRDPIWIWAGPKKQRNSSLIGRRSSEEKSGDSSGVGKREAAKNWVPYANLASNPSSKWSRPKTETEAGKKERTGFTHGCSYKIR